MQLIGFHSRRTGRVHCRALRLVLMVSALAMLVGAPAWGSHQGGDQGNDQGSQSQDSQAAGLQNEAGNQAGTLLDPDQAFRFEAQMVSPDLLQVTWHIAPDYYMYRKSFSVAATSDDVVLGAPDFPPGTVKHDQNFGDVEIYKSDVVFTVPVKSVPDGSHEFTLRAVGQGCNEPVGVCFPPVSKTATVQLAEMEQSGGESLMSGGSGGESTLDSLKAMLGVGSGSDDSPFLRADQAFQSRLTPLGPETLVARFSIHPGYYLYKDKITVTSGDPGVRITDVQLPDGRKKRDKYFGDIRAFYNSFDARIGLQRDARQARQVSLTLKYQGCAERGICYPPIEKTLTVNLPGVSEAAAATGSAPPGSGGTPMQTGAWTVLLAFVSGLLLTFTPCVLPMIPILAGIIVGQGNDMTRLRAGGLASVYVLGTAVTYTAVGVVAGLTGDQLQAYFQNAWAIGFIAALLVFMALSMFGLYELKMPSAIQSRMQHHAAGLKAGAVGGVFFMGILSALIVGACVSPVLISVLGLAIKGGDPVLGGTIMFAMALGMGLVLIVLGFGFGYVLPKTGAWMETVKHVFGLMLLAVAIYLLGAVPWVPVMYLWAVLLVGIAVYLVASARRRGSTAWNWAGQTASVLLVAWGVLAVIGGIRGGRDILQPVSYQDLFGASAEEAAAHVEFQRVSSPESLARLMRDAKAEGKPVMIDYYADWCVDCLRMEKSTFAVPRVARALNDEFVLIQVDVTDPKDPGTRAIKRNHDIYGPPAMLFFDKDGKEIRSLRRYGYMDSRQFMQHIAPLREG